MCVRHDRRSADSQQCVCCRIHHYVVGNAVYQGRFFPDQYNVFPELLLHAFMFFDSNNKRLRGSLDGSKENIALLFPSPVLSESGSKGMISVPVQNTPKAGLKLSNYTWNNNIAFLNVEQGMMNVEVGANFDIRCSAFLVLNLNL